MKRAALAMVLVACGHRAPPPPSTPVAWPSLPSPPAATHACVPAAPASGRFLSVRGRYAVGDHARIASRCDRLSVWTRGFGTRLFDPRSGVMTAPLPKDDDVVFDELLSTGAIGLWSDHSLVAVDRIDLGTRWKVPRAARGRVFVAGRAVLEQSGVACQPACAIVAHDAATGRERWRRDCACDAAREQGGGPPERYDTMTEIDGKLVVTDLDRNVEGWDASDGHTLWSKRHEHAAVVGKLVVLDGAAPEVTVLDASGNELGRVRASHSRIEALAADGETLFIASSDASEYGGVTRDFIEGFDVRTRARTLEARLEHVVRRYASSPPELWAEPGGPLYFFEIDNGLLSTIDRSGRVLSSMGLAGRAVTRTMTGFAAIDDEGVVEVLEPSETESPPSAMATVEGTLTLDGKPVPGIEVVVGDVRTTSGAHGWYSASVAARGHFWVKAKQPTASNNTAVWADADRLIEADGRTGPYRVNLDAKRDTLE